MSRADASAETLSSLLTANMSTCSTPHSTLLASVVQWLMTPCQSLCTLSNNGFTLAVLHCRAHHIGTRPSLLLTRQRQWLFHLAACSCPSTEGAHLMTHMLCRQV